MKKIELLAPAGSFEKAKIAFMYGADAVYAGTPKLSLRSRSELQDDDLEKTIDGCERILSGEFNYLSENDYNFFCFCHKKRLNEI